MENININRNIFYFAFGVSIDAGVEEKKKKCVDKAYLDLCRTIKYNDDHNDLESEKKHLLIG